MDGYLDKEPFLYGMVYKSVTLWRMPTRNCASLRRGWNRPSRAKKKDFLILRIGPATIGGLDELRTERRSNLLKVLLTAYLETHDSLRVRMTPHGKQKAHGRIRISNALCDFAMQSHDTATVDNKIWQELHANERTTDGQPFFELAVIPLTKKKKKKKKKKKNYRFANAHAERIDLHEEEVPAPS